MEQKLLQKFYQTLEQMNYQVVHTTLGRCRIRVPQVTSDSEYASKLNWLIESLNFVTSVRINPAASSLIVSYETSMVSSATAQEEIFNCIQQASIVEIPLELKSAEIELQSQVDPWERLSLPVVSLGVALLAGPLELSIPFLVTGGLIAIAAVPIFNRAIAGILDERKFKVDLLDSLWIVLQTLQGQYVAPALMLSLIESGATVRDLTARTTQRQTLELLNFSDRHAWVEREGEKQQISLTEVYKGDKVIVHPGELIPVDGRILHGVALIDEQNVTGDARPVTCLEGQEVYASTLLLKGQISVLAERTGKDTRAALVAQFLKTVPVADTQAGDKVGAVSDELIVPTLFLSSSLFSLTGNIAPALAPLQLDFGTGIGIAVPTTILAALTDAARSGVFIRNGRALESLARIDTIVFGNPLPQASANAIEILTAQGLEIYQLGDRQQQEVIRTLHEDGKVVAYVGSSSDTEVFANADLSISFAEETDLERETADVVVVIGNDLWGLIHAIDIAKRAMEIVYQNIAIVAVPNIGVVIAGIFFGLHPIAAVIVNNFAALIAELNGLRPLLGTIGASRVLNPGKAPQKEASSILTGSNG